MGQSRHTERRMNTNPIGVIGLGSLGTAMASRLVSQGHQVWGFDIEPQRCREAATQGVQIVGSAAELGAACDLVLLSLPDSHAVRVACLGADGLARSARPGRLVIDTTSGYPRQSIAIAAELASLGICYIDAAITAPTGGANAVREGALTFIIGGAATDVERARPVLDLLGTELRHVGPTGAGQIVKLVNNSCASIAIMATVEGLLVAAKHGLDLWQNLEVMRVGTGLTTFARFPELFLDRDRPGAHIGLLEKDTAYMSQLAQEARVPTPVMDLAGHLCRIAARTVGERASIMQIANVMEAWADVKLELRPREATDARPAVDPTTARQTVGIIGLGNIGAAISNILVQDGLEVYGYDLDPARMAQAAGQGMRPCASPTEVAATCRLLILALPQSSVVEQVLFGDDGVAAADNRGLLVIDTTSGYPEQTREFAARLSARGMRLMDAAITGERGGALAIPERNLTFIIGGAAEDVALARPVLDHFCSHLFHLGPLGAGQIAKMVNNMVCAVVGVGLIEGLLVAARHGVDYQSVAEVLDHGTGASFWTHNRGLLNPEPMKGGFYVGLMTKDLRQMSQISHASAVPNPLGEAVYHLYQLFCRDLGYYGGIAQKIEVMQRWAGITLDGRELGLEALE
ncbi:NAD(P)-dependent oxidoreductase [Immundisolibacter sp.]|uniref:NAD(P)-dependent oxidoreductase n=1 Tax=Immundisolibacter sp. TaxID=1934948 RepID=UPI00356610F0